MHACLCASVYKKKPGKNQAGGGQQRWNVKSGFALGVCVSKMYNVVGGCLCVCVFVRLEVSGVPRG